MTWKNSVWRLKTDWGKFLDQRRLKMPIVTINMLEGRTKEQKTGLIKNVSSAVTETLGGPPESVRVIINEMPFDHYGIAGLPVLEYRALKRDQMTDDGKRMK